MNSIVPIVEPGARDERIAEIARELIPLASQLTRLALRRTGGEVSRSEGGVMRTLSAGPRSITELAELEGLAQPTMTTLVNGLERRGWVARRRDAGDGRRVLVTLTPEGSAALERFRARYRAPVRDCIATMDDARVTALEDAVSALDGLVIALQKGAPDEP